MVPKKRVPTNATPSCVRKLTPEVRMPTAPVLRSLSEYDNALLEQLLTLPIECQFAPSFQDPNVEAVLMGPMPESKRKPRRRRRFTWRGT